MIWGSYKVYKSVSNGGGVSFRGGWLYDISLKGRYDKSYSQICAP